jgi:hypothetical protein
MSAFSLDRMEALSYWSREDEFLHEMMRKEHFHEGSHEGSHGPS